MPADSAPHLQELLRQRDDAARPLPVGPDRAVTAEYLSAILTVSATLTDGPTSSAARSSQHATATDGGDVERVDAGRHRDAHPWSAARCQCALSPGPSEPTTAPSRSTRADHVERDGVVGQRHGVGRDPASRSSVGAPYQSSTARTAARTPRPSTP